MNRRSFLKAGVSVPAFFLTGLRDQFSSLPTLNTDRFEIRQLTSGPAFHWFGYYDKLQVDRSCRYVLGMQTSFEMRSPGPSDEIKIGVIDLKKKNSWREIGKSSAWSWQQGCMLQWIPGSRDEVIWNDREGDGFVSHVYNIRSGKTRTLPKAVYALSPDGKFAVGTEFSRIQDLRPGYGYAGLPDPYFDNKAPDRSGIYRMDLETGDSKILFSLADIASIPHRGETVADNFHWFNHLLVNTDGTRFTFLHRWRKERTDRQKMAGSGFVTRMFTASSDGSDLFLIDPSGFTSHFVWRDPYNICAWTRPEGETSGFYLLEDKTGKYKAVGAGIMSVNGHNTYVPGTNNEWILCDTYPQGENRQQELYLFHIPSNRKIILGNLFEPKDYSGEWRCDLHPKCSPDGRTVIFDSTHGGSGRQIYMLKMDTGSI